MIVPSIALAHTRFRGANNLREVLTFFSLSKILKDECVYWLKREGRTFWTKEQHTLKGMEP